MGRQDTRGGKMKITRTQLRKLINEAMIKPGIPNYDDAGRLGKEIDKMRQLGNDFADSFSHDDPYVMGAGEGYYLRRGTLGKATEICNSFDISLVRPLIDAFTEGANDYQRANAARTGRKPRLYKAVDMANQISSTFGNKSPVSYMSLYDND